MIMIKCDVTLDGGGEAMDYDRMADKKKVESKIRKLDEVATCSKLSHHMLSLIDSQ